MTIAAKCPRCGAVLKVPEQAAGRRGKCGKCGAAFTVPARPRNVEPPARRIRRAALAALQNELPPVRRSFVYLAALPLVAAVMLALPALYVAVVALAGYGVYYHAVRHAFLVNEFQGWVRVVSAGLYVGVLLAGLIVVLFLLKPLFARPAREVRTRSLTPRGEPFLFRFVGELCDLVGAPRPSRIDVDYQINAAASLRRGIFRSDLVLTLGTPLIAGLTLRQFTGVLAHELGHFRQGGGMRLSYLIRCVNAWFFRVAYERDEWDVWLDETANDLDVRFGGWMFAMARFGLVLTRSLLRLLMLVGHAVSGLLSRQMEYDADRCEALVAGVDAFEETTRQLRRLGFAYGCMESQVMGFLARGMYPDDMAHFMLMIYQQTPPEVFKQIDAAVDDDKTHWYDTHPGDADRIRAARRDGATGIFHVPGPASALLDHFPALCRNVTWDLYSLIPRANVRPQDLRPVRELLADEQTERIAARLARSDEPIPLD